MEVEKIVTSTKALVKQFRTNLGKIWIFLSFELVCDPINYTLAIKDVSFVDSITAQ
jgi:hypothetical protein